MATESFDHSVRQVDLSFLPPSPPPPAFQPSPLRRHSFTPPSRRPLRSSPLAGPALSDRVRDDDDRALSRSTSKRRSMIHIPPTPPIPSWAIQNVDPAVLRDSNPNIATPSVESGSSDSDTISSPDSTSSRTLPRRSPTSRALSRDPSENWLSTNTYETTPPFSRLSLAAPNVVLPLSAREYNRISHRKSTISVAYDLDSNSKSSSRRSSFISLFSSAASDTRSLPNLIRTRTLSDPSSKDSSTPDTPPSSAGLVIPTIFVTVDKDEEDITPVDSPDDSNTIRGDDDDPEHVPQNDDSLRCFNSDTRSSSGVTLAGIPPTHPPSLRNTDDIRSTPPLGSITNIDSHPHNTHGAGIGVDPTPKTKSLAHLGRRLKSLRSSRSMLDVNHESRTGAGKRMEVSPLPSPSQPLPPQPQPPSLADAIQDMTVVTETTIKVAMDVPHPGTRSRPGTGSTDAALKVSAPAQPKKAGMIKRIMRTFSRRWT